MVDHSTLLDTLAKYGTGGEEMTWFLGFMIGNSEYVLVKPNHNGLQSKGESQENFELYAL